ncbi:hypothetical protein [Macrococcus carouselicus]|uniref:ParB/Sulfiredoxin domain-containing protein n=1 Tax=Macrococcus carouselicus TaxID=69969 RepID=A0A9Q8CJ51_9STAP|nr:hypothetical protein [Macrococcus carouselicus]TDL95521.1 hypothetical protein ERX40_10080 [Macrococcus carouselicus]
MKLHYTDRYLYKLDDSFFNLFSGLLSKSFEETNIIQTFNNEWASVVTTLSKSFHVDTSMIHEVFTIDRLDYKGDLLYDFGFNIEKAKRYISDSKKELFKFHLIQFGEINENLPFVYQHEKPIHTLRRDPIIVAADYVTGRSLQYPEDMLMDVPLVIDGNHRVSYAKEQGYDSIASYYLSLDELIQNDIMLSRLDSALLAQAADIIKVVRLSTSCNSVSTFESRVTNYYESSYLFKYFRDCISN